MRRQIMATSSVLLILAAFHFYPSLARATENPPVPFQDLHGLLGKLVLTNDRIKAFSAKRQAVAAMRMPDSIRVTVPGAAEDSGKIAIQKNPRIQSAMFAVTMAKEAAARNHARMRPKLAVFVQAQRRMNDAGIPGFQSDLSAGIRLTANLYRGGADSAAIEKASRELEAVQSRAESVRYRVAEEARQAWSAQRTATRVVASLRQQVQDLEEFLRLAHRERKLGTRSLLDVLSGEIAVMNARSALVAAQIDQQINTYRLVTAMGGMSQELFISGQGSSHVQPE